MSADPPSDIALVDRAADQRQFSFVALTLGGTLSLAISAQAVLLLGINSVSLRGTDASPFIDLVIRVTINLCGVAIATLLAARARLILRTGIVRVAVLLWCAGAAAACRAAAQILVGIYPSPALALADAAIATLLLSGTFVFALQSVGSRRRARESERARLAQAAQATAALAALQDEELHVRREVADTLHGTLQGRVVMLQADLRDVASGLDGLQRQRIDRIREELDALRENELRAVSATLYPEGIDRGVVAALRALVSRIPAAIDASLAVVPSGAQPELDLGRRLALVRVAEEGVSNALRHGLAARIDIVLHVGFDDVTLSVRDDGVGVDPTAALSGLRRLTDRVEGLGGRLALTATEPGAELVARVPRR
ncbi:signal transduction histidine kinase [Microbacterium sp. SORGH_AS428]|uniref:sensor histidine kinase n=1 Tax=Microbacterium sp. SORGH_AS_0428 TaxID=3041788 RepID=UPI00285E6B00|nr:ATP-binding protein [Microbacterium sp. SORGH_AS_0428]MDR6199247.1 signal transduction histidine kinase [Microbacterium sp. SORGH_AS_0428]